MPSCLGLYIEDNLIKYAKVSKNKENVKVESFGVKFYENINTAIKQIVEETHSFNVPISTNSDDEWYNEIQVFSLLSKNDMKDAIETEFENICYGKEINRNIYEQKYIFSNSYKGDDKMTAIHISVPKTLIEQRKKQLADYKVNSIVPLSVSIRNLAKLDKKGTSIIVNIEENTTITKMKNGAISEIEVMDVGSSEILEKINIKENSYSKAYEICKGSTIYTETDKDLQYEENEYLEDIMPTLFQIVSKVRKDIDESIEKVDKVYITGTGAIINNIDIYFQDYLKDVRCEILKPSFINNSFKINIKDYIEVNSAIAIALQGLEKNNTEINFKKDSGLSKIGSLLTYDISGLRGRTGALKNVEGVLGKVTKQFDMLSMTLSLILIGYVVGALVIDNQFEEKNNKVEVSIAETNSRIEQIQENNSKFNSYIDIYKTLISNIEDLNETNTENKRYKNAIPNLLNNIMSVIPRNVQLISIENTSGTHIVIRAQSVKFQEIAYFKTKLDVDGILKNVVSDTGTSQQGYLVVTIEGELP